MSAGPGPPKGGPLHSGGRTKIVSKPKAVSMEKTLRSVEEVFECMADHTRDSFDKSYEIDSQTKAVLSLLIENKSKTFTDNSGTVKPVPANIRAIMAPISVPNVVTDTPTVEIITQDNPNPTDAARAPKVL